MESSAPATQITLEELAYPGTTAFLPDLLSCISAHAPTLPLDPVVLQSLLISLTAVDKNLILRTKEEDIGTLAKLTTLYLREIFGYETQRVKYRPSSASKATPSQSKSRARSTPSTPVWQEPQASILHPTAFLRSLFTTPSKVNIPDCVSHQSGASSSNPVFRYPDNHTHLSSRLARQSLSSSNIVIHGAGGVSPPSTLRINTGSHLTTPTGPLHSVSKPMLPRALVLTGLDHIGVPSQRALERILTERRIVIESDAEDDPWDGVRTLPEGFFIVYVCPHDEREMPRIQKSLVDRFAMSINVTLASSIRSTLSNSRSLTTLASRGAHFPAHSPAAPAFSGLLDPTILTALRLLSTKYTYISPALQIYTSDLFTAVRHHHVLDGLHITARARKDMDDLVRAARVVSGDRSGAELVRDKADLFTSSRGMTGGGGNSSSNGSTDEAWDDATGVNDVLLEGQEDEEDIASLAFGSVASLGRKTASFKTAQLSAASLLSPASSAIEDREDQDPQGSVVLMDVSNLDIARMMPRVLSHRVRVRDKRKDEVLASLVCPAVPFGVGLEGESSGAGGTQEPWHRRTVKDVMVEILKTV